MSDQSEPTPREKNVRVCAMCFGRAPTDKEYAKWVKYRYGEYVTETGGFSTMDACSTTPPFSVWLEMNQSREYWKIIPDTGERR